MPTDLPNVARVALAGTFDAERFVNVIHFRKVDNSAFSTTDLSGLLGMLDDASTNSHAWTSIWANMDSGAVIDTMTARTLDSTTPIEVSTSVSLAGGGAGNNLPPMLCAVVKWQSLLATRSGRGRTYLTGLSVGMVSTSNSDRLESTFLAALAADVLAFAQYWSGDPTYRFTILSEKNRQANVPTPYSDVLAGSVNPTIGVQRRRRESAV